MSQSRILCVIGDPAGGAVLISSLNASSRHQVTTVKTQAEALTAAQGEKFDLYLLNHDLPSGSGQELCRKIREYDRKTPILFLTGSEDEEANWSEAKSAGAQGFMFRPEGIDRFMDVVARLAPKRGPYEA